MHASFDPTCKVIFDRFWCPTSTPGTIKIMVFPKEKRRFFKKSPFEVANDFGFVFDASVLSFSIKNQVIFNQNSIQKGM